MNLHWYIKKGLEEKLEDFQILQKKITCAVTQRVSFKRKKSSYSIFSIFNATARAKILNSAGLSLEGKPNLQHWVDRCQARPAVSRGLDLPEPNKLKAMMNDPAAADKAFAEVKNMSVDATKK